MQQYTVMVLDRCNFFFFQYNDLMRKRRIVLNDKSKIAALIQELDEKKNEALKKAYQQVNKVNIGNFTLSTSGGFTLISTSGV